MKGYGYIKNIAAGLLIALLFAGCVRQEEPLRIVVSHIYGNAAENNYLKWLGYAAPEAELKVVYGMSEDSVEMIMRRSHGLLLTGGEDVYPGRYGQEYDTARCGAFDLYRDSLEFRLIELAMLRKMPVLGICRGQQILNVAMGGSLYVDIPTDLNTKIYHRCTDWKNCEHEVLVFPNSMLHNISGLEKGMVNSNHHQAVNRLAEGLRVMAVTTDGVIESIGRADTLNNPFLLGVQWHPERMDTANKLSLPPAKRFIKEAIKFKN
jgi:putative glutamine amidotransferase